MGTIVSDLRAALAFLTPLPVGAAPPRPGSLAWFPLAGALIGLALGGAWSVANEVFSPLLAAAVVVALDVVLTGALHLDGLADTADGVLSHVEGGAERRMQIMAAPEVGAFGVVALVVVLLVRFAALASIEPDPLLLSGIWCASRTAMALLLSFVPYVGRGLGSAFGRSPVAAWGLLPALALSATAGIAGVAALFGLALAVAGIAQLARRRLGGVTGDVLGAAGVVGETVALVVAAGSW